MPNTTTFPLTVKTLPGLEDILVEELTQLNAQNIQKGSRVVSFEGNQALLYRANLHLRTALRILKPIHKFTATNEDQLYKGVQEVDWSAYTSVKDTIAIDSTAAHSDFFNNDYYTSLKSKDAIVDQFRDKTGLRPSVDTEDPSLRINLHIHQDQCTLSLDSSGQSLHKRSYRLNHHQAPLNEVLAAGMILLTGWHGQCDFINPMSGSATLLIEAAMIAQNIPPNLLRESFGFEYWRDFDADLWESIRQASYDQRKEFPHQLIGCDVNKKVIRSAWDNIEHIGFKDLIQLKHKPFEDFENTSTEATIVINPPYGMRMDKDDIEDFYTMMGDKLKQDFQGCDAWILSANKDAMKSVGLRPSRKIALFNGSLPCKYHKYEMYRGSKKGKYMVK